MIPSNLEFGDDFHFKNLHAITFINNDRFPRGLPFPVGILDILVKNYQLIDISKHFYRLLR